MMDGGGGGRVGGADFVPSLGQSIDVIQWIRVSIAEPRGLLQSRVTSNAARRRAGGLERGA